MTIIHRRALNRLEPVLKQFGYQKPTFSQALQDRGYYDYYLTKGYHSFQLNITDWRVHDVLSPFLCLWIGVPHPERFMIYTANLQNVADSLLFETYWPRERLDDLLYLGLNVVCETPYVASLRNRLQSPVMQAALNSLLTAQDSFYLFSDSTYGFQYGVALAEPLERRAALWLNAAEQFASVFDDPASLPIAQRERAKDSSAINLALLTGLFVIGSICLLFVLAAMLIGLGS